MTVEEMQKVIAKECDNHPDLCTNNGRCPLYGVVEECAANNDLPSYEVERQYRLIVGEDNPVSHPSHYTQGGIECIDAMEAAFGKEAVSHFCICNAFKYVFRHEHKNGKEDIEKAEWYLNKYKELKYSE